MTDYYVLPTANCNQCGYEWHPRIPTKSLRCPSCRSIHWDGPKREHPVCKQCGHEWGAGSHKKSPRCPSCRSIYWDDPRRNPVVCVQCGYGWYWKSLERPQRCPNCSSPYWSDPSKDPPRKQPLSKPRKPRKPRRTKAAMVKARMEEECLIILAQLGDAHAREDLLRIHTPFVTTIAEQHRKPYIELDDLVSVGLVQLNSTIDRYELDHHTNYPAGLLTYAYKWINWGMSEAVTKAKRYVFPEEAHWYFDEKEWTVPPLQEEALMWEDTMAVVTRVLGERDLGIVVGYYIHELTLHELGDRYSISYERVRQLRDRAIHTVRVALKLVGKYDPQTRVLRDGNRSVHTGNM